VTAPEVFPISVCMIVRDEEENLRECLPAARALADQLVVVDTGSKDRSAEVARVFGAEVHDFEWCDDFAAARNASLVHARCPWIVVLDADDRLTPENVQRLRKLCSVPPACAVAVTMRNEIPGMIGEKWYQVRAFPNDRRLRYRGRVHESVDFRALGLRLAVVADVEIVHVGYADPGVRLAKARRNVPLLRRAVAESPEDALLAFSFADGLVCGWHFDEAEALLRDLLLRSERDGRGDEVRVPRDLEQEIRLKLSVVCTALDRPEEARRWADEALALDPKNMRALLMAGDACAALGRPSDAEAYYERMLRAPERLSFAHVLDHRGLRGVAQIALARLHVDAGRAERARALYERCLEEAPEFVEAYAELGDLLRAQGDLDGAEALYRRSIDRSDLDPRAVAGLVLVAEARRAVMRSVPPGGGRQTSAQASGPTV